ncbi:MAG TPA: hypothetical protein VEP66_18830, partial [Myxococcales bacterium]|nr:hypothetical protein [Myxococcales bacterium]
RAARGVDGRPPLEQPCGVRFSEGVADAVTAHSSLASRVLLSILVVGPLLWHTIWGIVRFARTRPNLDLTAFSNVRYLLQRLAALGLLAAPGALPLGCNRPAVHRASLQRSRG